MRDGIQSLLRLGIGLERGVLRQLRHCVQRLYGLLVGIAGVDRKVGQGGRLKLRDVCKQTLELLDLLMV